MTFLEDIKRITHESQKREEAKQNKLLKKELNSIISHIIKAAKHGQEYLVWEPRTEKQRKIAIEIEKYFKDAGFSVRASMIGKDIYRPNGKRIEYYLTYTISWEE